MKILFVITKSEIGGAQVFVLNLVRSLKQLGYQVEVAAGEGNYLFDELKKYGIPHHYLNSLKRDFSVLKSFYYIFDLRRLLKKNNYDIVHLNSSNTLFGSISNLFLKKKSKILFTFHGLSLLDKNYEASKLIKFSAKIYFRFFLKFINKTVFVSNLNADESKGAGIIKSSEVIYNGLDDKEMSFLSAEEARKYFSSVCNTDLSKCFLIGSTGRLAYPKNYEFLISNFTTIKEHIPNIKVVLIGNGPHYEKYIQQITKRDIHDYFFLVGEIKNSYKYIKAFDVFVLPSYFEGLSISLIEAVFAEVPILASDVGGNSEIVGCGSKQLYRLNDVDDFITKLLDIRKNKNCFIEANANLKNKFSIDRMVKEYLRLYTSLVE